jgi:colicin import membrane protein
MRRRIAMSRQVDLPGEASGAEPDGAGSAHLAAAPARRPNLSGDIDAIFSTPPAFRRRLRGYDRLQVDNYVIWAETERLTALRETDDLLDRYGRCWTELKLARQTLAHSPEWQQMSRISERIGTMLQLAADEAAEVTATAAVDADRVREEARADADALQRKAHEVERAAAADADRMRREAAADRAEAAAVRQHATVEVADLKQRAEQERERLAAEATHTRLRLDGEATQVRERLDREAAERRDREAHAAADWIRQRVEAARAEFEAAQSAAQERLALLAAEVAELEQRRETAQACLLRMSEQVSQTVAMLAESLPAPGLRLAPPHRAAS